MCMHMLVRTRVCLCVCAERNVAMTQEFTRHKCLKRLPIISDTNTVTHQPSYSLTASLGIEHGSHVEGCSRHINTSALKVLQGVHHVKIIRNINLASAWVETCYTLRGWFW